MILSKKRITKALISLPICAGWSAPLLFTNPQRQVFACWGPNIILFRNVYWEAFNDRSTHNISTCRLGNNFPMGMLLLSSEGNGFTSYCCWADRRCVLVGKRFFWVPTTYVLVIHFWLHHLIWWVVHLSPGYTVKLCSMKHEWSCSLP